MTEAQWLAGTNPEKMLAFVLAEELLWPLRLLRLFARPRPKPPTSRKQRLFMCACVRQVWDVVGDDDSKQAVFFAEQFADGQRPSEELDQSLGDTARGFVAWMPPDRERGPVHFARLMAFLTAIPKLQIDVVQRMLPLWRRALSERASTAEQSNLVRHIFGNPFRPYSPPRDWPVNVLDLANSLYTGQDCAPILADALEEAGHPDLGEHMRSEPAHPKGCWVLDLILGKS
jgi:hypothetical protein